MKVINIMEELVLEVLNEQWEHLDLGCKCDTCKADVYAITLNSLPPRYVTTSPGRIFVKVEFFSEQSTTNILCQLAKAADIVAANPSHDISKAGSSE
jgi:competence protein ComFB